MKKRSSNAFSRRSLGSLFNSPFLALSPGGGRQSVGRRVLGLPVSGDFYFVFVLPEFSALLGQVIIIHYLLYLHYPMLSPPLHGWRAEGGDGPSLRCLEFTPALRLLDTCFTLER